MRHLLIAASMCWLLACKAGGSDGPDAPAFTGQKYVLNWGPVTVHPGEENTQCVTLRLGNPEAFKVHRMHNVLSPGSHHMILYKNDMDTTEVTTPTDCQPFAGALNLTGMVAPVMITQKDDDELTLPDGVGYTLAANQMIRIEMHYINSTDADLVVTGTSEFSEGTPGTIQDEANILFIGSPDIDIPAHTTATVDQYFAASRAQLDLSTAKFFAVTGHTHRMGTNMTVATAATEGGEPSSIYAPSPFSWSEPETTTHKPEFVVPTGGGFKFKCEYNNTSDQRVKFGESATDEMCFFWAYYYPSKGSHVCVHTAQLGGVDICCPDAGAQLCNMLIRP